jgi:hypothetical protein
MLALTWDKLLVAVLLNIYMFMWFPGGMEIQTS